MSREGSFNEIAGFVLERRLGKGGMGAVYQARHPRTGAMVAVKVVLQGLQARDEVKERFRREVRAMAAVEHPNMVRILEAGEDKGSQYYVMELVDGVDLASVTEKKGALDPGLVHQIARGIFSALQALHDQGILHRDLKPHNVMLDRSGRPMIMDLGLTKLQDMETMTKTGALIGSPRYMPPEILEGTSIDARADIYQTGLILWECATGKTAVHGETFQEVSARILTGDIDEIEEVVPGFPGPLADVIHRCMEVDPEHRFASAAQALDVLEGREEMEDLPPPVERDADHASPFGVPQSTLGDETVAVPPDRPGWIRRVLIAGTFLVLLAASFVLGVEPPVKPPQGLELLVGVGRVDATWRGTDGVPVQLVAQDAAGNRLRSPAGKPHPQPPMEDGSRRLTLDGLLPGTEYEVYLTYADQRTLPRSVTVHADLHRERSPRLGATADGRPALIVETLIPVRLKLGYPRLPSGVAWLESAADTAHALPLDGIDLTRPAAALHLEVTDPTGKVEMPRHELTRLLREAGDALAEASESFDEAGLVKLVSRGETPDKITAHIRNSSIEGAIRAFSPLAAGFFESPDLGTEDRRRLVDAIEALRNYERIAWEGEARLSPTPEPLLAGTYGPADPPEEPWEIRGESRESNQLVSPTMYKLAKVTGMVKEYVIDLPKLPRQRMGEFVLELQVRSHKYRHESYIEAEILGGPKLRLFLRDPGQKRSGMKLMVRRIDPRDVPKRGGKITLRHRNDLAPPLEEVIIQRHRVAWRVLPRDR